MTEQEFWEELRLRINQAATLENLGYCDWIEPKRYYLGFPEPRVEGEIGFVTPETKAYKFAMMLPERFETISEIEWSNLLPAEKGKKWLELNGTRVEIDTSGAS